jgi:hypothetical protein
VDAPARQLGIGMDYLMGLSPILHSASAQLHSNISNYHRCHCHCSTLFHFMGSEGERERQGVPTFCFSPKTAPNCSGLVEKVEGKSHHSCHAIMLLSLFAFSLHTYQWDIYVPIYTNRLQCTSSLL